MQDIGEACSLWTGAGKTRLWKSGVYGAISIVVPGEVGGWVAGDADRVSNTSSVGGD